MPIIGDPLIIGSGGQYAFFGPGTEYVERALNQTINLKNDTTYDSWTASTTETGTIKDAPSSYEINYAINNSYTYYFVSKMYVDIAYLAGATLEKAVKRFQSLYITMVYYYPSLENALINNISGSATNLNILTRNNTRYYDKTGSLAYMATNIGPMYGAPVSTTSTDASGFKSKRGPIYARCSTTYFDVARKEEVDSANTNMIYSFKHVGQICCQDYLKRSNKT